MSGAFAATSLLVSRPRIMSETSKLNGPDSKPVNKLENFEVSRNKDNGQENTLQLVEDMIFVTQKTLQYVYNRCSSWPSSAGIESDPF